MLGCLGILSTRIGALSRSWTGQFFFRALHNVTQDKCFGHIFDGTLSFSCPKFKKKNLAGPTSGECSTALFFYSTRQISIGSSSIV